MAVLRDLVRTADVVQHNMRYDAAERLGVDYESLRQLKPDLIYCHTRPRPGRMLPLGNDQTGAALAGVVVDGGRDGGHADLAQHVALAATRATVTSPPSILQAAVPTAHRAGAVPRHVDPLRPSAEHVVGVGASGRHARQPAGARRDADRLERPVPVVSRPPTGGCAWRSSPTSTSPTSSATRAATSPAGLRGNGSRCSTARACRVKWRTPTSCCRCSTIPR